jgi:hypothetical protein
MRLNDLKGRWAGETVWVVGSSGAWGWLDPRFFDDKRTVAINFVGPTFGLSEDAVTVSQYASEPDEIREMGWGGLVIAPDRHLQGGLWGGPEFESDDRTIRDAPPPSLDFVPFLKWWPEPDEERLFHGTTSLHMAMACAWWMGASTIITAGADHGWWQNQTYGPGYNEHSSSQATDDLIRGHWIEHTNLLAAHLRSLGTDVYSMIPTVNLNLEGLTFRCPRGQIG